MIESTVNDYPPLKEWLDKHSARFCYALTPPKSDRQSPRIEAWRVKATIVLVVLYPKNAAGHGGWDLYTSCGVNKITETLVDAEARIQ